MSLAFGSAGSASAAGTTSLSVAYPASIVAGDLLVLCIVNKLPTSFPTVPSGWTQRSQTIGGNPNSDGSFSNGGRTVVTILTKVADGTESGSLVISIPSGNSAGARMLRYTGSGTYTFGASGGDFGYGFPTATVISIESGSLAALDLAAGDVTLVVYGSNSARIDIGQGTLAEAGITFGTATTRSATDGDPFVIGNNCDLYIVERPVTAGSATATPTATLTNSSFAADDPHGGLTVFRIREASAGGTTHIGAASLSAEGSLVGVGSSKLNAQSALAAEGTLGATTGSKLVAQSNLSAEGSLVANAFRKLKGSTALTAATTLVATGRNKARGQSDLSATSTLTATGTYTQRVSASLSAEGTVNASSGGVTNVSATLSVEGSLVVTAVRKQYGQADLQVQSSLTVVANVGGVGHVGVANLSASATLAVTPQLTLRTTANLSVATDLTASGARNQGASASLSCEGSIVATGILRNQVAADLVVSSSLDAAGSFRYAVAAALEGSSDLKAMYYIKAAVGSVTVELADLSMRADVPTSLTTVELIQ